MKVIAAGAAGVAIGILIGVLGVVLAILGEDDGEAGRITR